MSVAIRQVYVHVGVAVVAECCLQEVYGCCFSADLPSVLRHSFP